MKRLFESPDNMQLKDPKTGKYIYAQCWNDVCKPFAFKVKTESGFRVYDDENNPEFDELWVGEEGEGHSEHCPFRPNYVFDGRLWFKTYDGIELKVISFWKNDIDKYIIERILRELSSETGIDFSDWYIDCGRDMDGFQKLIPVKEYEGGIDLGTTEEDRVIHLLSWEEKQALKKKGWGRGWGSDMTAWGGKNPLQWRQAKYQEKKILKYNEFKKII